MERVRQIFKKLVCNGIHPRAGIWGLLILGILNSPAFCGSNDCASGHLAGHHLDNGLSCTDCHQDKVPRSSCANDATDMDTAPLTQACIACHGSYDTLSSLTATLKINPHASPHHQQMLNCIECHKVHRLSDNFCIRCHYTQTTEPGWQSNSQPYMIPLPEGKKTK